MYRISQIKLSLKDDKEGLPEKILKIIGQADLKITSWNIVKESIDARKKDEIHLVYTVDFCVNKKIKGNVKKYNIEQVEIKEYEIPKLRAERISDDGNLGIELNPVIVGFGPAGIFAALILAEAGLKPIVLERGQSVDVRKAQVDRFWKEGILDENSNVQFGEGGAGTFSDGKLTTGIKDLRIKKVLREMVEAGGPEEILYKSKPHIGTDVLREVVKNLREKIIALGGQVRFGNLVKDVILEEGNLKGLKVESEKGEEILACDRAVFALGHSSRDTFRMFYSRKIFMEQKPFSMGVRIEHSQDLIDLAQYGAKSADLGLPPAEYKLNHRCENDRGVYTFCMCPGGEVVIASSQKGGVVTNGMSYHARNSGTANSGLLVDVRTSDFGSDKVLAGVEFQEKYEKLAFLNGGSNYKAPKSTWGQLRDGKAPNVEASLPSFVVEAFREAMPHLARKLKGFDNSDAIVTAVEARSSSPVRILRDKETLEGFLDKGLGETLKISGFYPAGEGAGYAGGIMSAACDGIKIAEAIIKEI